jgi:hypothetical protein
MLGSPFDPTLQKGLLSRATFDANDASIGEQVRSDSIVVWWNEALLDGRSGRRRALSWPTFSSAALQAGLSRPYGEIHFERGDLDGRATGRAAAAEVWEKSNSVWRGGDPRRLSVGALAMGWRALRFASHDIPVYQEPDPGGQPDEHHTSVFRPIRELRAHKIR